MPIVGAYMLSITWESWSSIPLRTIYIISCTGFQSVKQSSTKLVFLFTSTFIPCWYDLTSRYITASAPTIGCAWKSCCSSTNADSSHGSTEFWSHWSNTMELAAGIQLKTTHIPLETFKSKLKTHFFTIANDQWSSWNIFKFLMLICF